MNNIKKNLWIAILILAIVSPVGIALPGLLKAGDAWGEWSLDTIQQNVGFIPEGMKKTADLWHSPIPDYSFTSEDAPFRYQVLSYIGSAAIGIVFVYLVMTVMAKLTCRKD